MPRRKKRQPVRRNNSDSAESNPTSSKRARREEEDELSATDRGHQLIKCLGLNDQLWQPAATVLDSLRLYRDVIRIHQVEDPGSAVQDATTAVHIGRVFLLCDVAGISNILNDHVQITNVELRIRFNRDKRYLLVSAITPSHPQPVVLISEVMMSVREDTVVSPEVTFSVVKQRFLLHLGVSSITSVVPLLVSADQKMIEPQGTGHYSLPNTNCARISSDLLKLLFPSILNQANFHSVTQNSQRTMYLSITEQILKFYQDVKACQKSQSSLIAPLTSPIPHLTAVFLNYQVDALRWMLARETEADQDRNHPLHILWRLIRGPTEDTSDSLYYNPFSGMVTSTHYTMPLPPRGGILADEMGLGKTVEILALVLSHTWPGNQPPVLTVSVKLEEGLSSVEETGSVNSQQSSSSASSRRHGERIWCVCGADRLGASCDVQCQECRAWQHSSCVDYEHTGDQGYTCIHCLLKQPRPCGATLIIVPNTLLPQWLEEIDKHTDSSALSVLVYEGVAVRYRNPLHLAWQDIVIVSYETIRKELDRVHYHEFQAILRHQKRYTYPPSPLLALCWWRVCLDEAQTVETTNAKAAEMTHKLTAINRWCVTGTPVQRTLGDLYGLVYFLDHAPYCVRQWYDHLVWKPYLSGYHTPILELFAKLMWRNTKEDVSDELVLPEQSEKIHWLSFSAVEAYYYNRQREMCSRNFSEAVSHLEYDADISDLSRSTIFKLMAPLHSLRQACCHPQLVRGGYIPFSTVNKRYITMDELLKKLEMQAMVEGREHLRLLVMSLNGIAAIHILQEKWELAVDTYREAMTSWAEQEGRFDCDKLQRIHTMENLSWLLQQHSALGRATSDDQLDSKATELRSQYLNKADLSLKTQVEVLLSTIHASNEIKTKALEQMKMFLRKDDEDGEDGVSLEMVMEEDEKVTETQEEEEVIEAQEDEEVTEAQEEEEVIEAQEDEEVIEAQEDEEVTEAQEEEEVIEAQEEQRQQRDEERPAQDSQDGETGDERQGHTSEDRENSEERQGQNSEDGENNEGQDSENGESRQTQNEDEQNVISWDAELIINQQLGLFSQPWWVHAIALVREKEKEAVLIYNVNSEVTNSAVSIRDLNGLQLWLNLQADKMERARSELLVQLQCLAAPETPLAQFVADVCDCHLKKGHAHTADLMCDLCLFENNLQHYASLVFQTYSFRDEEDISRRQGVFETALNVLYSAIKKESPMLAEAGKLHLSYLENARKEFKHMQSVWMAADFRVRTCDELAMAAKRLRLATNEEQITGAVDLDAVLPYELGDKMMGFKREVSFAKQSLSRAVGQLGYLHNLSIANGTDEKESCPICCGDLTDRWVVFPCSHSMCLECTYKLMKLRAPSGSSLTPHDFPLNCHFSCPLCRKSIVSQQVNFIHATTNTLNNESTAVNVKGSHSTKITAVVTTLSTLRQQEPEAKSLVFSSNYEVLKLISKALDDNEIPYVYIVQKTDFQKNLKDFKTSSSINVALMQLSSGSKGLNIVEATHVLLVEPSLNIGSEQQAIGRVHRVGQTKPTTVHRYYVRDTVEEKIKELLTNTVKIDKFISSETSCPLSVTELRSLLQ